MDESNLMNWSSAHWPVGMRVGRLTILATFKQPDVHWTKVNYFARCVCECGSDSILVKLNNLKSGNTQSCGCVMRDGRDKTRLTRTPIGRVWKNMMRRCYDPSAPWYENYGGRGITVCPRWHDVTAFATDMQSSYDPTLSIERVDNDGNYSPENCRWATRVEQSRNRRSNVIIEFNGRRMCLTEWAEEIGVSSNTLRERIKSRGWSIERALTTPVN